MSSLIFPFDKKNLKDFFSIEFLIVITSSIPSAIIADFLKIPLAWMIGPMFATSILSLYGISIKVPKILFSFILLILSLHIGSYIDLNLFDQIYNWIWTTIIMFFYILVSIFFVSKYLQKFSNYSKQTSIFSAAPGALGPLIIIAEYEKTDLSQVATSHLIRLFVIITILPFIINHIAAQDVSIIEQVDQISNSHFELVILFFCSFVVVLFFDKLKIPAALLSGSLVSTGFLKITGIASYNFSNDIINICLLVVGSSVGCRFAGKSVKDITNNLFHGLVSTLILIVLGLIAAFIATFFVENNFLTLLLSFCPGGIYEIAVIAITFNLEPEFVAFHHVIRLLFIVFTIPILLKILKKMKILKYE